ncbi:MAG: response regulator [Marinilabiliaceae bacterium]|nr:response regulator [Marinilabiliaceae bacterium]
MIICKNKLFKLGIFLLVCTNIFAFEIKKMGVVDGLSNNNVVSITQDKDDYIWICTKDGLNRFDGNSFKVFKHIDSVQNSIASNTLNCVYADKKDDIIWIATEKNGISAYNYKKHQFTHYRPDNTGKTNSIAADGITHITSDSRNNLWLATYQEGIDYFDKSTGQFTHYNQSNIKGLGSNYNWYVMCYNDSTIYVGHVGDGLSIINLKTKTAINIRHQPQNPNSLPDNTVTCIYKDLKNNIWIGTRNGLTLFNHDTYQMINFKHDPKNKNSLSHNFIKSFVEANDSTLWIGTEGGGINIISQKNIKNITNPESVIFKHILASYAPDGLSSSSVQTIIKDSFGNFWIGGYIGGINFISGKKSFFNKIEYLPYINNKNSLNNRIAAGLATDKNNQLWIANRSGGVNVYQNNIKVKQYNSIDNKRNNLNITCIINDSNNNIWFGTIDSRIIKYNIKNDTFKELNCFSNIQNLQIYSIFEDSKYNLWFATDVGLLKYNTLNETTNIYSTETTQLSDNIIRAIGEDTNGNIWVGTLIGGLMVFDQQFALIKNYSQQYDFYAISSIYRDSKKRMWIASQNDLFLFNNITSPPIRIGKQQGLEETFIRSIIEGKTDNDFWISTTNGISHIELNTMQINNFKVNDGIIMGDYIAGSVTKLSDGTIYFGTQNGITYFNQQNTQKTITVSKPVITGFFLNNYKNENLNEFVDIPYSNQMNFIHKQNSFQINFNVLDYSISDKVEFIYQMQGLDNNWFLIDNNKKVTFRNLKPGNYTFNLKCRLHNKEWQRDVTSLQISIQPPWWSTRMAKLSYLLIIFLIVHFIIRFYKNKVKIENELLFEKKSRIQEQELNEEKIRFFTNITHELRTPMTLILGPIEDLASDQSITPEQLKKINSVQRVANRLLQLINQILDFRKSETKNRQLSVVKTDFASHIANIGIKFKELNKNKQINFKINTPNNKIEMFFDPEVTTIIVDNLLSNAFKYTNNGDIILDLNTTTEQGISYTDIKISDTGFGISENDLPHIFDRYYQAKNTSYPVTGTGIGLALVKNMVELHEAQITVQSNINTGTVFTVRFLTHNSYPNVNHITIAEEEIEDFENQNNSKPLILIVDDNLDIIDYIHDSLAESYTVITAQNGKEGFETACEKVPDIVISDIMMPIMDGISLCKEMKKDVRTCHIPIILLTAKDSIQDKSEGYNAGADSYLTKPFSGNLLKSRLKNILDAQKRLSNSYSSTLKEKQASFNESANKMDRDFLEKLSSVIEANIEDEEMNISYIATLMNMSHSTLYRKIKALTDMTANEFIRKIRMKVAEHMLITGKYSISEVMYRIGINSNGYFRQCFKDEFGMNPSDYLHKLKGK